MPLTSTIYQTLLRVPVNGQSVSDAVLLTAGPQSFVAVGPQGTAWVSGAVSVPLFPGATPPDYTAGDSFLLHVTAQDAIDQTLRFGGAAMNNDSYASLTSTVAAPAVPSSATGSVMLPGTVTASVSASLLATQRFDLPLVQTPNAVLTNNLRDAVPAGCAGSMCMGSAALLASVTASPTGASLSLSVDASPTLTLRNAGSVTATGIAIAANGFELASDCGTTLAASSQCSLALTGAGPGSVTVTATNAATVSATVAATTATADAVVPSTREVDFGIVTSVDRAASETVTVANLTGTSQTFRSARDGGASGAAYTLAGSLSDCASGGASGVYTLAANAVCHIVLQLTAGSSSANDGAVRAAWRIGNEDVAVTGFAQAAALAVSATEVDFGTVFAGGVRLARYLYLSNDSRTAIAHNAVALPAGSAFTVADGCPSVLEARSVCRLTIAYAAATTPSADAVTLALDAGLSVLLTGTTQPAAGVTGSTTDPSLGLSATALSFATPVVVTGISNTTQTLTVSNTGATAFALALAASGEFPLTSGCPAQLAGGASCNVLVGFAPAQPGTREGLLSVTAGNGFAPAYVALSGTGSAILPENNGVLALGQTLVGEPVVLWTQVQQSLTTLTAAASGTGFGVVLVPNTGGGPPTGVPSASFAATATAACAQCWLGVQYLAQSAGAANGTLTLTTVATGNAYRLTLTATALPVTGLLLTPMAQDFGTVAVNSASGALTFTLTDALVSAAAATVQSVTASGDFTVVTNGSGGASCSGTVAATASCFVQVAFSPTATGARTGILTIMTDAGTVTATLTGWGIADPGLAILPTALTFLAVPGTAATTQTAMLSNTSSGTLTLGTMTASDPSFALSTGCATLMPGAMCSVAVTFTPQSADTAATLSIPVTATVNGQTVTTTYSVALTGGYTSAQAGLELLPAEVNFGAADTGTAGGTREFTLNNLSGKALNVTLELPREFPLAAPAACATLAVGASCSFSVSFVPETNGAQTGTVFAQATSTDGTLTTEALTYMLGYSTGAGSLTVGGNLIPNTALGFGQVGSGQSTTQTLTLNNSGAGTLTVRRISSEPPFLATSNCGATLAAGASCAVTLSYTPVYEVATGTAAPPRADTGTLTIESDAASSPTMLALVGSAKAVTSSSPASSAVLASFTLSEGALTFANTAVGSASAAQTVTMTNTGTTTIHILSTVVSTPVAGDFTVSSSCSTLLPGAACSFQVAFTPQAQGVATLRTGTLEILSDAGTSLDYVSLVGSSSAAPLALSPATLSFGTVNVGASGTLSVTVTNTTASPILIVGLSATGDYSVTSGSCPVGSTTLAAGASCTVTVTFKPSAGGTRTGTLSVANNATALPLTVPLSGTAARAQLTASPAALEFGSIAVGAAAQLTVTLTNTGTASVTGIATSIAMTPSGAGASAYAVTTPCSTATLAPNQGCTLTVSFTPGTPGALAATLTIASSDPNGPATVALTGSGAQGGSFTLAVNGGSAATVTVTAGTAAVYALTLTPQNGYSGAVALTCTPVAAAASASCSLLSSLLTLNGAAVGSAATINTVTSAHDLGHDLGLDMHLGALAALLMLPLALWRRRDLGRGGLLLLAMLAACMALSGCGSAPHTTVVVTGGAGLAYTPAGSYQYQVTASATSGTTISSTVTLNLIVQ